MYIRKTKRVYKGKSYTNHLLVESVLTAKGPRQRTICSLGNLEPAPSEQWLALAHKLESGLQGQLSLSGSQAPTARVGHGSPTGRFARRHRYRARRYRGASGSRDSARWASDLAAVGHGYNPWPCRVVQTCSHTERSHDVESINFSALRTCHAGLDSADRHRRHSGRGLL